MLERPAIVFNVVKKIAMLAVASTVVAFCLFAQSSAMSANGFIASILTDISDLFLKPKTQWLTYGCFFFYIGVLVTVEWHLSRSQFRRISNRCLWISLLVVVGAFAYVLGYPACANLPSQAMTLLAAIVLGRVTAVWCLCQKLSEARDNCYLLVIPLLVFLTWASLPGYSNRVPPFSYHGQLRWSGPWEGPNIYGCLMGVGILLAVGGAVSSWKFSVPSGIRNWKLGVGTWLFVVLFLIAASFMARGLLHSYSRGACVATGGGMTYLLYQVSKCQGAGVSNAECGMRNAEFSYVLYIAWLRKNWLPSSVILASVFILSCWHFRQTEWHPARRALSAVNPVDFSWRNRLAAWEGTLQIMAEHPWFGAGWNQPEPLYQNYYLPPKLNESAAIQMNDYLMLGATLGVPALFCFAIYVWLSIKQNLVDDEEKRLKLNPNQRLLTSSPTFQKADGGAQGTEAPELHETHHQNQETGATRCPTFPERPSIFYSPSSSLLAATCRAGAIVLLIGFWFDGGLFKLPTATTFWILLELGSMANEHDFFIRRCRRIIAD